MSHPLVDRILSGEVPQPVKLAAARGALPLSREDFLELWIHLRNDADPEVRLASKENLAEVTEEEWITLLPDHPFSAPVLDFSVRVLGKNPKILDAALRNRGVSDDTLAWLAQTASGEVLDRILDNQVRLIASPAIAVALLSNPALSASQVRRLFDMAEQFFRDRAEITSLLELRFGLKVGMAGGEFRREAAPEDVPEADAAEAGSEAAAPAGFELPETLPAVEGTSGLEALPDFAFAEEPLSAEKFRNLYQQILTMSVPAKIELALKGNKEARGLLIRDSNKVVQEAVLDSPKLTDVEIDGFVRMRNLPEDLFRKIERNHEWMKRYSVLKGFLTNPKVPPGLSLKYLPRLTDLDLKLLAKDRNVSELLRREARKVYDARHSQKSKPVKK
jgi:hypothetical protein